MNDIAKALVELPEYSQGICGDAAAILKDGVMLTVDEIVAELNTLAALVADADRYRWLKSRQVGVLGQSPDQCLRTEKLDEEIDRWMRAEKEGAGEGLVIRPDAARAGGGN